jgi:sortase A
MLFSILKRALFIAGSAMLGYVAFTILEAHLIRPYKAAQFDQKLRLPANLRMDDHETGTPIGRLTILSAGISAIVLEGDDEGTLKIAPGHIPGTAFPGESGNVAIAAHRNTFFRNLATTRHGDFVTLTTLRGTYEYTIDSAEIVDRARTDVLESSCRPTLTLVTCYPFHWVGPAPKRFIVHAHHLVQTHAVGSTKA